MDDFMSIPADKMTLEQARNAVKVLRERYLEVVNADFDKEAEIMDLQTKLKSLEIRYDMAIKAIQDIKEKVWEIDIPSPTIPEYIEHHEQVKSVLIVIYNWLTKLEETDNETSS